MVLLLYKIINKQKNPKREGFTLLELLVSITIFFIVVGIGFWSYNKTYRAARFGNHLMELSNTLYQQKDAALLTGTAEGITFVGTSTIQFVHRDTASGTIIVDKAVTLPGMKIGKPAGIANCPDGTPIETDGINFQNNRVLFLPIGVVESPGCIVLSGYNENGSIVVSPAGKISIFMWRVNSWLAK